MSAHHSVLHAWRPVDPSTAAAWLSGLEVPWWIAGGWAIDLYVGQQHRPHLDIDIGILRRDLARILNALSSWEFFEAKDGALRPLGVGDMPGSTVHSLWCRPINSSQWALELMLDEAIDDLWCYRRDPSIRRPFSTVVAHDASGIPFLAPEIQLLYKARSLRQRDQVDFELVAPRLDAIARAWLVDSLERTEVGHPWISAL